MSSNARHYLSWWRYHAQHRIKLHADMKIARNHVKNTDGGSKNIEMVDSAQEQGDDKNSVIGVFMNVDTDALSRDFDELAGTVYNSTCGTCVNHSYSLWYMMRDWKRMLLVILWSVLAVGMMVEVPESEHEHATRKSGATRPWLDWSDGASAPILRIAAVVGFLLAFRCNQGYNRWWEARVLWGKVIGKCLRTAQLAAVHVTQKPYKRRIWKWLIAFPVLLKCQLKGPNEALLEERERLCEEWNLLEVEELHDVASQQGWLGGYAVEVIRACFLADLRAQAEDGVDLKHHLHNSAIDLGAHLQIEDMLSVLTASIGGLMRLKGTAGQPMAVGGFLDLLVDLLLLVAPVVWAHEAGWFLPPTMGLFALVLYGMLSLSARLERPFCDDATALDMERFISIIMVQVKAVERRYSSNHSGLLGLELPHSARIAKAAIHSQLPGSGLISMTKELTKQAKDQI